MQRFLSIVLTLVLLTGCRETGIRGFWDDVPLIEDNLRVSEDRFADFAEKAVAAPEGEALAEFDSLFARLRGDEIAYRLYAEWVDGAFYSILSPCRNAAMYSRAVEHFVGDGIFYADEYEPFVRRRDWIVLNTPGSKAQVPGFAPDGTRTLVLVLDISCPSCREALTTLGADPRFVECRRVAVCCGDGPEPVVPGWEYIFPGNYEYFFDIKMTPVYFVISPSGEVEQTYTLAI